MQTIHDQRTGDENATGIACRLCGAMQFAPTLNFPALPSVAMQWSEAPEEQRETHAFSLETCLQCGLMQNRRPLPLELLNASFEENVSSTKREPHIAAQIDLILQHVSPLRTVDVGCNDGRFLLALRERGAGGALYGIEPNRLPAELAMTHNIPVVNDLATPALCAEMVQEKGAFDLVITRQVVEHLDDYETFFASLRTLCADDGYLFVDVPDMTTGIEYGDSSVLWEEHLSYFTAATLQALLLREGFHPVATAHYDVAGGTVAILARKGPRSDSGIQQLKSPSEKSLSYGRRVAEFGKKLEECLARAKSLGYEVAIYGTTRAHMAINGLGLAPYLSYVVDDQPFRQGKYFPGAGLKIVPSSTLAQGTAPLICLLAVSHQNEAAVRTRIAEIHGRTIVGVTLCAPGDIWGDLARLQALIESP